MTAPPAVADPVTGLRRSRRDDGRHRFFPRHPLRRALLRVLRFFLATLPLASAFGQTSADYAAVRARLRAAQTGGDTLNATDPVLAAKVTSLNSTAQTHWTNLNKSATRTSLWSDLGISTTRSDSITPNYERLKTLAAAYATNGAANGTGITLVEVYEVP